MSEEKNLDNQESIKESEPSQELKGNEEKINADKNSEDKPSSSDKVVLTQEQYNALRGVVSGKDKKLSEVTEKLNNLERRLAVNDKLLNDTDIPDVVRNALAQKKDNLDLESYETEKKFLLDVYENAQKVTEKKATETITNNPQKEESKNILDKLLNAKTPEEYNKILEENPNAL